MKKKKKRFVVERTKFIEIRLDPNESRLEYMHRLKEASKYCEFGKLGTKAMAAKDFSYPSQIARRHAGNITQTQNT